MRRRSKRVLFVLVFLFTKTPLGFGTPALTGVSPSSGVQGATLNLTLTGSGFGQDMTVTFSGTGVIVNGVRVKDSTALVVNVTLLGDAGPRTISVTSGLIINAIPFEVLPTPLSDRAEGIVSHFTGPEGGIGGRDARGTAARFYWPSGIWADKANLYVVDAGNFTIRKVSIATADVTTLAGYPQQVGNAGGIGPYARFGGADIGRSSIGAVWGDGSNLYVQDGCAVRKIVIATAEVSTFAGVVDECGTVDGPGDVARLRSAGLMTGDGANLYWIDPAVFPIRGIGSSSPAVIRIISLATGQVRSLPSTGGSLGTPKAIWAKDGYLYTTWPSNPDSLAMARVNLGTGQFESLFQGQCTALNCFSPAGLWFDGRDSFYFVENTTLRRLVLSSGDIQSIATLPAATPRSTISITGSDDDVYLIDDLASIVSRVHLPTREAMVFAGLQSTAPPDPPPLVAPLSLGFTRGAWSDGPNLYTLSEKNILRVDLSTKATTVLATGFGSAYGIWGDTASLYVADFNNNRIQRVDLSTGIATTLAVVQGPVGIWGDSNFVYATADHAVRRITKATGEVITFAGSPGQWGVVDGIGTAARFPAPWSIWGDSTYLNVGDQGAGIRRIRISTAEVTKLVTKVPVDFPKGIAGDGTNLYVTDVDLKIKKIVIATGEVTALANFGGIPVWMDQQSLYIRSFNGIAIDRIVLATGELARVTPPMELVEGVVPSDRIRVNVSWTDGEFLYGISGGAVYKVRIATGDVTHIAGAFDEFGLVDAVGNHARFSSPTSLWGDGTYLYVTDFRQIRRINIATRQTDTLTSLSTGFLPKRVWGDGKYLYLTDNNYRVIERASIATGEMVWVAGNPEDFPVPGIPNSVDGIGAAARFVNIGPIWGDGTNLYVSDRCSIRKVVISTFEVTRFVGLTNECVHVDGSRDVAKFGIITDIWGNGRLLFVASPYSIRTVDLATGDVQTIAGHAGYTGTENGNALDARFVGPDRVIGDGINLYVSDNGIRKISFAATTQPIKISANGATSWANASAASPLAIGYARFQPEAGALNPNGIAVFSYRSNGVLVSETSVQASNLIQSGRIYAEIAGAATTAIAIANPNPQSAAISFYFTDKDGVNFASGITTIGANQQIAAFLNEAPFNGSAAARTFTFSSSMAVGAVAMRALVNERSDFLMTSLPVAPINASAAATIVLPQFATGGGWTTQILLVNPTDEPITGFVGMDGPSAFYSIAPRSAVKVQSNPAGPLRTGTVTVTPALVRPGAPLPVPPAPNVSSVFSFVSGGVTMTESGIANVNVAQSFRIFAELDSARAIRTGIAIANTDSAAATIQFELLDLSGQLAGYSGSTTLPPNGHLAVFLDELPGFQSLPPSFRGVLHVSSNTRISTVGVRGLYNEHGDFILSTIPALADTATRPVELLFPHFVTGGGCSTEFILMSAGPASSGSLLFRSQSGIDLPIVPAP